ncbi:MAG: glycosyltransferase family 39 protein [Candidatus Sungbacteria bacterium]|nr:glycosyltransferase family 39 protein [Candidatus Sungbacteria bacterium]
MAFNLRITSWVKKYKVEILLFCVALLARIVLFSINLHAEQGNLINTIHGDDGYFELSRNLVQGHGISWEDHAPYLPNPLRPPVYPLFLAIPLYLTGSYWVVALCQMLVGSLIPLLGMLVSRQITGSRSMSWWVGWLLAFEPYSILLSFIFYTETLFTALFLLFLLYLFRYTEMPSLRSSAMAGLFLGLATLVKPTVQYLPILLPAGLAWYWTSTVSSVERRDRWSKKLLGQFALFFMVFLAIIAPWLLRNRHEFGVLGMSAQPSFNLMVYLVPSVRALENGTGFQTEYDRWFREQNLDWRDITLATSKTYQDRAVAELKKHPAGIIKSIGVTLTTFFTHDGMLVVLQHAGISLPMAGSRPSFILALQNPIRAMPLLKDMLFSPAIIVMCARMIWILGTLLFLCGIVLFFRDRRFHLPGTIALFLIAYFALTTAINGLGVNARFRIPVNALILTFAVYGFTLLGSRLLRRVFPIYD